MTDKGKQKNETTSLHGPKTVVFIKSKAYRIKLSMCFIITHSCGKKSVPKFEEKKKKKNHRVVRGESMKGY